MMNDRRCGNIITVGVAEIWKFWLGRIAPCVWNLVFRVSGFGVRGLGFGVRGVNGVLGGSVRARDLLFWVVAWLITCLWWAVCAYTLHHAGCGRSKGSGQPCLNQLFIYCLAFATRHYSVSALWCSVIALCLGRSTCHGTSGPLSRHKWTTLTHLQISTSWLSVV